jgi:Na+/H+ antiporter NhaD/arsenite permease-like protein
MGLGAIISAGIFLFVFISIAFQLLHETAAALLGAVAVFLVTYVLGSYFPALQLLTFEDAMDIVDWNVIFLIMGMMIFMAILAETNVFKWMAFRLYLGARGNVLLIVIALVTLTGFMSAFLNNVTAIFLMVPLSIQIAIAIGFHPFAIVIPQVLASNIGGAATLIGDPPSTIVGSHIGLSFGEYLIHMAPIAIICMIALLIITWLLYRRDFTKARKTVSSTLVEQLASEAQITNHATLYKALVLAIVTFVGFLMADKFNQMPPGVVALSGAAFLIIWVRPDMHRMLREVDWTTLLFFIGLFIVVGAMEATGAIHWLSTRIAILAGESVYRAALLILWVSGIASGIVENIPFAVAALPVADFLTSTFPGAAESKIIYWALILGADLGGNSTYLGSASNIVAVGLLAQAGYRLSFGRFMRDGVPVTFITLLIVSIWLVIQY